LHHLLPSGSIIQGLNPLHTIRIVQVIVSILRLYMMRLELLYSCAPNSYVAHWDPVETFNRTTKSYLGISFHLGCTNPTIRMPGVPTENEPRVSNAQGQHGDDYKPNIVIQHQFES
jgi:hypothetical protein